MHVETKNGATIHHMEPYYFGSDMKPRLRRRRRYRMFRAIKAASFKLARLSLPVLVPVLGVALIAAILVYFFGKKR